MTPERREKLVQLYKSWKEIVELHQKMGNRVLALCSHPDATPEQIMEAVAGYRRAAEGLRSKYAVTHKAMREDFRLATVFDQLPKPFFTQTKETV
jgi:hypothetical protein